MDHKVSKDMISSGMTPSGEKTQADLGRTQYGSAPSPSKLMDAYHSMYQDQKKETLDEKLSSDDIRRFNQLGQNAAKVEKKNVNRAIKDERRERVQKTYDKAREQGLTDGVDLLAAYRAVYEHHKKDENGNTIPHEDEINEAPIALLAPLAKVGAIAKGGAAAGAAKGAAAAGAGKAAVTTSGGKVISGGAAKLSKMQKVGKAIKDVAGNPIVQYQAMGALENQKRKPQGETGAISASADLFDIVKGQLLDEGLSEEEIRDIMLSLTPDEIMEELSDIVKRNDAINKAKAMERAKQNQVPQKIRDASKRQMKAGTPREDPNNPYTTQDKKDIINYNKDK